MTEALVGAGELETPFESDLGISCGPALTTPVEMGPGARRPAPSRGRGIGGILAPAGMAPNRAGGIPGGGPGGIRSGGRPMIEESENFKNMELIKLLFLRINITFNILPH